MDQNHSERGNPVNFGILCALISHVRLPWAYSRVVSISTPATRGLGATQEGIISAQYSMTRNGSTLITSVPAYRVRVGSGP